MHSQAPILLLLQAYTSQILAFVMFALMMSEDRVSMQPRRRHIIDGLRILPGRVCMITCWGVFQGVARGCFLPP